MHQSTPILIIQFELAMSLEPLAQAENRATSLFKVKVPIPTTSSGSQHTQQGQQERTANENELNDDHCFKCSRKGELYCCDRCFRAFHKHCVATKRFSKVWTCQYCNASSNCLACQLPLRQGDLQDANQLCTCTICFRAVHRECSELPPQLSQLQSHFFQGSSNFVCGLCIRQFGFRIVLNYQRVWVRGEERLFYFVSINTRSPLHCGWFEEETLRDVPRCKEADQLREAEVYEVPAIERIVRMKFPPQIKREDYDEILGHLLAGGFERTAYGRAENFFCLLVWEGRDHSGATWEDQNVVSIHNANNPSCRQLAKYLLFRKAEIALREKRPLSEVRVLFDQHIPNPPVRLPASQASLYEHFKANLISSSTVFCLFGDNNLHYSEIMDFLCFSLQQIYKPNILATPTLLVCSCAGKWERRLKQLCPQLNVVVLKGSENNAYQIKQKELFFQTIPQQHKFQILIIPLERWNKERKYLSSNPFPIGSIFFDLGQPELIDDELTCDKQVPYQRRLFLVENRRMLSRMLLTNRSRQVINLADSHEDTLVYDFCTAQVLNSDLREVTRHVEPGIELQRIGIEDERTFKSGRWDELKRVVFLRYILAFGFAHSPQEQFQRLLAFDRGTFLRIPGELERMRRYSERFMAVLWDYKNLIPREDYHRYYLSDVPIALVYKRVVRLAALRHLTESHRNKAEDFPQPRRMKVFMDISVEEVGLWRGQHDYLLAAMVLQRGFGKWVEIAQDREWQKWASSCHMQPFGSLKKPNSTTFGDFVRDILQLSIKREIKSFVKVAEILRERGEYLLTLNG